MGNMGIWQLLILLIIVLLLFGTKRLRGLGSDLGGAIKGFKKAVEDGPEAKAEEDEKDAHGNPKKVTGEQAAASSAREATDQEAVKPETKQ